MTDTRYQEARSAERDRDTQYVSPLTAAERGRATGSVRGAIRAVARGRLAAFGTCSPADLSRDGFSPEEIGEHWPSALMALVPGQEAPSGRRPAAAPRDEERAQPDRERTNLLEASR